MTSLGGKHGAGKRSTHRRTEPEEKDTDNQLFWQGPNKRDYEREAEMPVRGRRQELTRMREGGRRGDGERRGGGGCVQTREQQKRTSLAWWVWLLWSSRASSRAIRTIGSTRVAIHGWGRPSPKCGPRRRTLICRGATFSIMSHFRSQREL